MYNQIDRRAVVTQPKVAFHRSLDCVDPAFLCEKMAGMRIRIDKAFSSGRNFDAYLHYGTVFRRHPAVAYAVRSVHWALLAFSEAARKKEMVAWTACVRPRNAG